MSEVRVAELRRIGGSSSEGIIKFFKKGGSYYAIEEDASLIAQKYLRSIGSLRTDAADGHYVMISEILYASLLRDILLYNRRSIELYEFESNHWSKTVEASPGNVTQVIDLINNELDLSHSSILLAIAGSDTTDQYAFNAACCDPTLFTIATTEFVDSSSLCHFETLLTQTMPSEILFCGVSGSLKDQMNKIIQKFEIPTRETGVKSNIDVGDLPKTKSVKALLSTLQVNLSEFEHRPFELCEFMTVDFSAANALNIFPDAGNASRGLPTSLYQLLNECVTPMGSRLLHQYMQQPLVTKELIDERLAIVDAFRNNIEIMQSVRESMRQLPDVARLVRKFVSGKASLQDCVRMHDVAVIVPGLKQLSEVPELAKFSEQVAECESDVADVSEIVKSRIDFSMIPQHVYRILPTFDEDLTATADSMEEIKDDMEQYRTQVADDICVESDKLKLERATNQKSFFFRMSRQLERNIRNNDEYLVIETRKDGVHFTTRKLRRDAERFFELENEYIGKQKEIASQLVADIGSYALKFQSLNDIFAQIDVFAALAMAADKCNFTRPTVTPDSSAIKLIEARHPLVEKHCTDFIANDVEMVRGSSSFMIISGPNSAGKSTILKTVGICVYLAHIGSFIPCDEGSIVPVTCSIHARVGAWDSFQMSTFTVEMTEMASILQSAKPSSLVLVDELGRSTSCSDGFGLAWAISKHLATEIGSFCLFATHFHELCNLEAQIPSVANFHMDARADENLLMLYKLKSGPFPKSFGIDAAKRAGFPPSVMKRATEKAYELELADSEEGEKPSHIRINPNEPYYRALGKLAVIKMEEATPAMVVERAREAMRILDEELAKNNPLLSAK